MNFLKRSVIVPNLLRRHISVTSKVQAVGNPCPPTKNSEEFQREIVVNPSLRRLKETQKRFQVDDGLPVWLKGGFRDKLLLQITLIGLGVGLIMSGQVAYELVLKGFKS